MIFDLDKIKDYIQAEGLNKPNRKRESVYKRVILCHYLTPQNLTLSFIGSLFGKDHSTVLHYQKVYEQCKDYEDFKMIEYYIYNDILKCVKADIEDVISSIDGMRGLTDLEMRIVKADNWRSFQKLRSEIVSKVNN